MLGGAYIQIDRIGGYGKGNTKRPGFFLLCFQSGFTIFSFFLINRFFPLHFINVFSSNFSILCFFPAFSLKCSRIFQTLARRYSGKSLQVDDNDRNDISLEYKLGYYGFFLILSLLTGIFFPAEFQLYNIFHWF